MDSQSLAHGFIKYLEEQKKLNLLPEIIKTLSEEAQLSAKQATVESAVSLSESQKKDVVELIADKWGDKQVTFVVNPKIIGGLLIRLGDQTIDLTVASRMQNIYEQI